MKYCKILIMLIFIVNLMLDIWTISYQNQTQYRILRQLFKTMPAITPQSQILTDPHLTMVKSSLISKIIRLRMHFAELGYSQCEFHQQFVSHIFGIFVKVHEVQAVLMSKIKKIETVEEVQSFLKKVQIWEIDVRAVCSMENNRRVDQELKVEKQGKEVKNTQIVAKRKQSKDAKQVKKQKKHKADKIKKSKKVPTGFVQLASESDENDNDVSILKDRTQDLVNMLNQQPLLAQQSQSSLQLNKADNFPKANPFARCMPITSMPSTLFNNFCTQRVSGQDPYNYDGSERQNQTIFQKLVQIQMLTRLLCAGNTNTDQNQEDRVDSVFGMGF